jgi:ERCC4-type nuclease
VTCKIMIDTRERRGGVPELLPPDTYTLVGNAEHDYAIAELLIVERKTWPDFLQSRRQTETVGTVRVNKVVRQLFRAQQHAQSVWLVLEGHYWKDDKGLICGTRWTAASTDAFIRRLRIRGVQVEHTASPAETAALLRDLYQRSHEVSSAWPRELSHAAA